MPKICRNLSLNQFADKLREIGFSIGVEKLGAAISAGYFGPDIAAIQMAQTEYLIPERAVNEWIDRHAIEVEVSPEIAAVVEMNRKRHAQENQL